MKLSLKLQNIFADVASQAFSCRLLCSPSEDTHAHTHTRIHSLTHNTVAIWLQLHKAETRMWEYIIQRTVVAVFLGLHIMGSICVKMPAAPNVDPCVDPQAAFRISVIRLLFWLSWAFWELCHTHTRKHARTHTRTHTHKPHSTAVTCLNLHYYVLFEADVCRWIKIERFHCID